MSHTTAAAPNKPRDARLSAAAERVEHGDVDRSQLTGRTERKTQETASGGGVDGTTSDTSRLDPSFGKSVTS